jgi:hypothetical protein
VALDRVFGVSILERKANQALRPQPRRADAPHWAGADFRSEEAGEQVEWEEIRD